MNRSMILGGNRQRQLVVLQGAQSFGGRLHQDAPQAVPLKARLHAELRGVTHSRRYFAGEDRANQIVAARMTQHERSTRLELAASRKQHNILQKFQRAMQRTILVVDVAINVVRVRQVNQLGA